MEPRNTLHITTISITAYCFLRSWFAHLTRNGHRVVLACTANEYLDELASTGAEIVNIPISRSIHPVKDTVSLFELWKFMRRGHFHCVHTHTSKAGFLGRLAAKLSGSIPLVLHTVHDLPHNSTTNPFLKGFYIMLERLAGMWTHHVVTVSYANLEDIKKYRIVPEEKVTVIREGIDLANYQITVDKQKKREELKIPASAPVVGIVARLEAAKGHVYLMQAAQKILKEVPECYFVLVGRGHLRGKLESLAGELGIASRVLFTGFRDDMLEIMNIFDIFTLPSLWEGLGIVLLEAMAFRLPIVATRVGGITDVVVDGETGILVPPKDPDSLADAIIALLGDNQRASGMGAKGYIRVMEEFSDSIANEKMMQLYEKLLENRTK